jgi:hypothetical protein
LLRSLLLLLAVAGSTLGCTSTGAIGARPLDSPAADSGLVGAWIVTATRARGAGKNLLTFSSDGTFFRSGDTHPVYSGGHGAWKRVGEGEFDATYIAFNFDPAGNWTGSNKVRIHIVRGPGPNEFTAATRTTEFDLQEKPIAEGQGRLSGKRIEVEPF